jgi:hypothetical protein
MSRPFVAPLWAPALLLVLGLVTAAQDAKPITIDGKLTRTDPLDRLRKESFHRAHELRLSKSTAYLIELSSKDFDTFLRIEDADGAALAENDDAGHEDLNSRVGFVPPQSGKYRAVVTSFKGGQTGAYRLAVHALVPLGAHQPVAGKLTKSSPANQGRHFQDHGLRLKTGALYVIEMEGTGFTPALFVGDGRGPLAADANRSGAKRARAVVVPEAAGTYRLTAAATRPGATGVYWVTARAYELPTTLAQATPAAGKGATPVIQGRLTEDDPFDRVRRRSRCKVHEVKLEAGRRYRIDLTSTAFDTYLRLEDDAGKTLAENDDVSPNNLNSRLVFVAPRRATYRLVVTTYEAGQTGAYRLAVRAEGAPDGPAPP